MSYLLLDNQLLIDDRKYRENEMRSNMQQRYWAGCKLGIFPRSSVHKITSHHSLLSAVHETLYFVISSMHTDRQVRSKPVLQSMVLTAECKVSSAAYGPFFLASCVFDSLACFSLIFLSLFPFSLSHSLLLILSLWADGPSALILLCTVLLQMRQARRLSNPCIQRYTSRIGECSSTYVSSSKSPL